VILIIQVTISSDSISDLTEQQFNGGQTFKFTHNIPLQRFQPQTIKYIDQCK